MLSWEQYQRPKRAPTLGRPSLNCQLTFGLPLTQQTVSKEMADSWRIIISQKMADIQLNLIYQPTVGQPKADS